MTNKALLLGSLALTQPAEFLNRVATILEVRMDRRRVRPHPYASFSLAEAVDAVGEHLAAPCAELLAEPELAEIERRVNCGIEQMPPSAPFHLHHNADFNLARFCYVAARMLKPEVIVETGVGYGVTSAFILAALAVNGNGCLHSVDLPPLGCDADRFVGHLIPGELRHRWYLHRGASRRVLPQLLPTLPPVGMFVHDSLHTYHTMRWEFEVIAARLASPALVIADNVGDNAAFHDWTAGRHDVTALAVREIVRSGLFGVAIRQC